MAPVSDPADLHRRFLSGVGRLGRALRAAHQQVATEHRLSPLQVQLVEHIGSHEPQRVGALAMEFDVTQPTISDALGALETKGLVERRPDPTDGRASIIDLTTEGENVSNALSTALAPLYNASAGGGGDGVDLGAALHAVLVEIQRLQASGVISVNRSCLTCDHYLQPVHDDPARCVYLDEALRKVDLRVDCPDHLATAK